MEYLFLNQKINTWHAKTSSDIGKQVNIIVLKSFNPNNEYFDNLFEIFDNCIEQFDNNDYPIAVILPMNGGGIGDLVMDIEELLAPHTDSDLIGSMRISEGTEDCIKNEHRVLLFTAYNSSKIKDIYHSVESLGE